MSVDASGNEESEEKWQINDWVPGRGRGGKSMVFQGHICKTPE